MDGQEWMGRNEVVCLWPVSIYTSAQLPALPPYPSVTSYTGGTAMARWRDDASAMNEPAFAGTNPLVLSWPLPGADQTEAARRSSVRCGPHTCTFSNQPAWDSTSSVSLWWCWQVIWYSGTRDTIPDTMCVSYWLKKIFFCINYKLYFNIVL